MRRRSIGIGLAGASLMLASACGLGGAPAAEGKVAVGNCQVDAGIVGPGKLTGEIKGEITFQTTNLKKDFADYFQPVIDAFQAKHPGTKINWIDNPGAADFTEKLVAQANACQLPDVVNLNITTVNALARAKFLLNFDTKAPDAGGQFVPSIWNSITLSGVEGHTALPWYWSPAVLTYNTDLMTKAGLDPNKPPKTVMEMLDMAGQVAAKSGGNYTAFLANPRFRVTQEWLAMGAKVISDDNKKFVFADDAKVQKWLAKYKELYQAGAMPKDSLATDDTDPSARFSEGKLVFGSYNASFLRYIRDNAPSVYPNTTV
ncbi:MAG TPA: extracellular solute-binding protein, partial [Candidatus Limnocylindrales bacterium]